MDDEELLALLEQAEEDVAAEVSAVLREVADEFAAGLDDATEIVAARFSVSRIARMFTDRMPRIVRRLLRISEQAAEHTAEAADAELPPEWKDLPGRDKDGRDLPPAMSEYVTVTEHLLRAVGDRLAEAAREELAAGVDAGEDMEQLRARLRARFDREGAQLGEVREERIARTEAGWAWNTATLGAARDATGQPAPIVKQWITRRDDRVREDHADVNGTIRLLDEQFTAGGFKMDAPPRP
ncbi:phage minor head protein [Streptomyces sp. BBFR51]|uniref:phage minor head protein n=1 Tax=Streptomyces sp. BBFR51 TaxID=3372856 RepID=UPI0037DCD03B